MCGARGAKSKELVLRLNPLLGQELSHTGSWYGEADGELRLALLVLEYSRKHLRLRYGLLLTIRRSVKGVFRPFGPIFQY